MTLFCGAGGVRRRRVVHATVVERFLVVVAVLGLTDEVDLTSADATAVFLTSGFVAVADAVDVSGESVDATMALRTSSLGAVFASLTAGVCFGVADSLSTTDA